MSNGFKEKVAKFFGTIETFGELYNALTYDPISAESDKLADVIWLDVLIQDIAIIVRHKNMLKYPHLSFEPIPEDTLILKDWCNTQQGIIDADIRPPDLKNINEIRALDLISKGKVSPFVTNKEIAGKIGVRPDTPKKWKSFNAVRDMYRKRDRYFEAEEVESRKDSPHHETKKTPVSKKDFIAVERKKSER